MASLLVKIKNQGGEVVKFRVSAEVFEVEEAGGGRREAEGIKFSIGFMGQN